MTNTKLSEGVSELKINRKWIALTIFVLVLFAGLNTFIQDDAFITFRYAENLVEHHDLTWNPGERPRVEGYTNFLWTIIMTVPVALNWDPVLSSQILGLLFALGTFIFIYKLALLITRAPLVAWITLILIGTNYSFSAYTTGGLETSMQVFLITTGVFLTFSITENNRYYFKSLFTLSIVCAFSLLTRLDSAIPFGVLYIFLFWQIVQNSKTVRHGTAISIPLILPVILIAGSWLTWKYFYYGDILPNSYYVKASFFSLDVLKRGLFYIYAFLRSYFLIPIVIIAGLFIKRIFVKPKNRILLFIVVIWCLYVIRVGGDFMEFRFLIPILPIAFILASDIFSSFKPWTFIAFSILIFAGSLNHYFSFTHYYEIEPISALNGHIRNQEEDWGGIGRLLKKAFSESDKPVVIATRAAGAIPFYSKLTVIDMLGLNDKWIARHGVFGTTRPGHQKRATLKYLLERDTHLVIGHPKLVPIQTPSKTNYLYQDLLEFGIYEMEPQHIPLTSKIIEFPVNSEFKLPVLYLCQHDFIDDVITQQQLKIVEIKLL